MKVTYDDYIRDINGLIYKDMIKGGQVTCLRLKGFGFRCFWATLALVGREDRWWVLVGMRGWILYFTYYKVYILEKTIGGGVG